MVIATTSSAAKSEMLKNLGADHVIKYTEDPNWGETVKNLTPEKEGVTHVVEVGGPTTLIQVSHHIYMSKSTFAPLSKYLTIFTVTGGS